MSELVRCGECGIIRDPDNENTSDVWFCSTCDLRFLTKILLEHGRLQWNISRTYDDKFSIKQAWR
jgi:hypothetical protein